MQHRAIRLWVCAINAIRTYYCEKKKEKSRSVETNHKSLLRHGGQD